eukprot:1160781-Pelagomonas_calceolata.AAC.2
MVRLCIHPEPQEEPWFAWIVFTAWGQSAKLRCCATLPRAQLRNACFCSRGANYCLHAQERKQQLKDAAFKRETVTQMQQMRVEDVEDDLLRDCLLRDCQVCKICLMVDGKNAKVTLLYLSAGPADRNSSRAVHAPIYTSLPLVRMPPHIELHTLILLRSLLKTETITSLNWNFVQTPTLSSL